MTAQPKLLFHWSFDTGGAGPAQDWATGLNDAISGWYNFVPGVSKGATAGRSGTSGDGQTPSAPGGGKGLAVRFDGFTSFLERKSGPALEPRSFSTAAWIAPGAYPWRLSPIIDMAPAANEGFHLSLYSSGHIVFSAALGTGIVSLRSPEPLALAQWSHVAAVHEAGKGLTLFIDGRQAASAASGDAFRPDGGGSVFMARSRQPQTGTGAIRYVSHLPIPYHP